VKLADKVAVVTGAARGIGAAVAERFGAEGAFVHLVDRDPAVRARAAARSAAAAHVVDLSEEAAVDGLLAAVRAHHPAPDILVGNAGINPDPRPLVATPPGAWDAVMATNVRGTYLLCRAFVPHLATGGSVVLVASMLGTVGAPSVSAYATSKAGVLAIVRSLVADESPRIRVNAICPGAVQTAMFDAYLARTPDPEAERARIVQGIPLGRVGRPEEIASAALFLASEDAAWITGHALVVDGGDSV